MRCFLGFATDPPLVTALRAVSTTLREDGVRAQWLPEQNWHMTLVFLGDISATQQDALMEPLRTLAATTAPVMQPLSQVCAFPGATGPLLAAEGHCVAPLAAFQAQAAARCRTLGIPVEMRPYRPHVTLARHLTSRALTPQPLGAALTARRLCLYQSEPNPDQSEPNPDQSESNPGESDRNHADRNLALPQSHNSYRILAHWTLAGTG